MLNENEMFEKAFKIHLEGRIKEAQKIYLKLVKKTEKKHNLFFYLQQHICKQKTMKKL